MALQLQRRCRWATAASESLCSCDGVEMGASGAAPLATSALRCRMFAAHRLDPRAPARLPVTARSSPGGAWPSGARCSTLRSAARRRHPRRPRRPRHEASLFAAPARRPPAPAAAFAAISSGGCGSGGAAVAEVRRRAGGDGHCGAAWLGRVGSGSSVLGAGGPAAKPHPVRLALPACPFQV